VQAELKRIQRRYAITFILVTHDQGEAIAVSDRILVMQQGRIIQDGTPEDVYERPVSRFVAEFMGSANQLHVTRRDGALVDGPFGPLQLGKAPPWQEGHLAIRLEDIEVRDAQPAVNGFAAVIAERLFRGDHWELRVQVGDCPQALRVMTNPDQHHVEGQTVWIELPPAYLMILED
jgi:spermidine/putrescine transport system ATP-binding protein